jgi:hypothetical protein
VPLKPVSSTPAVLPAQNPKTGTSVVKSAPPKETARITVKPSLPGAPVRAGANFPVAKAAAGAVPVVAAAAGAAVAAKPVSAKPVAVGTKPATTIIKSGGTTARATAFKPNAATSAVATSTEFHEEGSTTLTTALAFALAVLTWGTAGVLIASYLALI